MDFSLLAAIIAGLAATAVFTILQGMARMMGMTKMDIVVLLGTMFGPKGSGVATLFGWVAHLMSGIIFGIIYGAIFALIRIDISLWLYGAVIGLIHGLVVGGMVMPMMGSIHPRIRDGSLEAPGTFGSNLGKATPMGLIVMHIIFGLVLGGTYGLLLS